MMRTGSGIPAHSKELAVTHVIAAHPIKINLTAYNKPTRKKIRRQTRDFTNFWQTKRI